MYMRSVGRLGEETSEVAVGRYEISRETDGDTGASLCHGKPVRRKVRVAIRAREVA